MYDSLAGVYEFLVPEALLSPEGSAAAFDAVLEMLPADARVLDCACGIGTLAVGLALRGFEGAAARGGARGAGGGPGGARGGGARRRRGAGGGSAAGGRWPGGAAPV